MPESWRRLSLALGALFALAASGWAWGRFGKELTAAYEVWRYPAVKPTGTLGQPMKRDLDRVRRAELTAHYRRVMERLDEAEKEGFIVGTLREKLPAASRMIRAGHYDYARVLLSSIEVRVPKKREVLAPAAPAEEPEEAPAPKPRRRRR